MTCQAFAQHLMFTFHWPKQVTHLSLRSMGWKLYTSHWKGHCTCKKKNQSKYNYPLVSTRIMVILKIHTHF